MIFVERLFGSISIDHPVRQEIFVSQAAQRASRINQAGSWQYINPNANVSRLEHCFGTGNIALLLERPVEEQIHGDIHDFCHTGFSHVVDYVYETKNQDFHENLKTKFLMNSEIPNILQKNGFDVEYVLDESNFPIVEKPSPDLCADRIDYALRDYTAFFGKPSTAKNILESLVVENEEIMFNSLAAAQTFGLLYLVWDKNICSNPKGVACFYIMAEAIKEGLEKQIISENDLFSYDSLIYKKLRFSQDQKINNYLDMLNPSFEVEVVPEDKASENPKNFDIFAKDKGRWIDPKVIIGDTPKRLSELYPFFSEKLVEHKEYVSKKKYIKIVNY